LPLSQWHNPQPSSLALGFSERKHPWGIVWRSTTFTLTKAGRRRLDSLPRGVGRAWLLRRARGKPIDRSRRSVAGRTHVRIDTFSTNVAYSTPYALPGNVYLFLQMWRSRFCLWVAGVLKNKKKQKKKYFRPGLSVVSNPGKFNGNNPLISVSETWKTSFTVNGSNFGRDNMCTSAVRAALRACIFSTLWQTRTEASH